MAVDKAHLWMVEMQVLGKVWMYVREPRHTRRAARSLQVFEEQSHPQETFRVRKYVRVEPSK